MFVIYICIISVICNVIFFSEGNSIEDLYTSLAKKSAEIYIQRSKQLYCKAPIRSKLFTWQIENLEIVALADLSYHGKKAVVNHMQQVDSDR